jgi:hypothetical protein
MAAMTGADTAVRTRLDHLVHVGGLSSSVSRSNPLPCLGATS